MGIRPIWIKMAGTGIFLIIVGSIGIDPQTAIRCIGSFIVAAALYSWA